MSPGTGEDDLGVPGLTEPERIGAGGFAVVYRAFQPAFRRPVAVKVLTVDIDERARRRFERECQALGALSEHPGIVTVHDAGFTSGGRPYLVMSHLPGGSLADRLDRSGALPWPEVLRLAQPLAQALAAAAAGITHCDLKPANVLTRADGSPQLADFGIARIAGEEITATASVTASFPYAAPEVVGGQTPGAASDVYSFGATLHELMAGRPPSPCTRARPSRRWCAASWRSPPPTCTPTACRPTWPRWCSAAWPRTPDGARGRRASSPTPSPRSPPTHRRPARARPRPSAARAVPR